MLKSIIYLQNYNKKYRKPFIMITSKMNLKSIKNKIKKTNYVNLNYKIYLIKEKV